ncbi:MAG: hypothetical protein ACI9QQ_000949 [Myxococcota bacterium]
MIGGFEHLGNESAAGIRLKGSRIAHGYDHNAYLRSRFRSMMVLAGLGRNTFCVFLALVLVVLVLVIVLVGVLVIVTHA